MDNTIQADAEWDFIDYIGAIIPVVNIVLWIIVIYAIVKLYKKIINYLDKNSQK